MAVACSVTAALYSAEFKKSVKFQKWISEAYLSKSFDFFICEFRFGRSRSFPVLLTKLWSEDKEPEGSHTDLGLGMVLSGLYWVAFSNEEVVLKVCWRSQQTSGRCFLFCGCRKSMTIIVHVFYLTGRPFTRAGTKQQLSCRAVAYFGKFSHFRYSDRRRVWRSESFTISIFRRVDAMFSASEAITSVSEKLFHFRKSACVRSKVPRCGFDATSGSTTSSFLFKSRNNTGVHAFWEWWKSCSVSPYLEHQLVSAFPWKNQLLFEVLHV